MKHLRQSVHYQQRSGPVTLKPSLGRDYCIHHIDEACWMKGAFTISNRGHSPARSTIYKSQRLAADNVL